MTYQPATREQLQAGLIEAMKVRDTIAVKALRSALAAIANAEAVSDSRLSTPVDGPVAGGLLGVGAAEAPRRILSELGVLDIVHAEIEDRIDTARQYDELGQTDTAVELRAQAGVLQSYLDS